MAVKSIDDMTKEELQEHYLKERTLIFKRLQEMENQINDLQKTIEDNEININDLKLELPITKEKLKQAIAARYQSQKNQVVIDMPTLFGDVEEEALKVEMKKLLPQANIIERKRQKKNISIMITYLMKWKHCQSLKEKTFAISVVQRCTSRSMMSVKN